MPSIVLQNDLIMLIRMSCSGCGISRLCLLGFVFFSLPSSSTHQIAIMPGINEQPPFKVLIVGGSYAGLAATLNLVDLCQGRKCRFNLDEADKAPEHKVPVQITIVDERDGYCTRHLALEHLRDVHTNQQLCRPHHWTSACHRLQFRC